MNEQKREQLIAWLENMPWWDELPYAKLEAENGALRDELRMEYIVTPRNDTICLRCGTSWAIGSPHEHHEDDCPLYVTLLTQE